MSASDFLRNPKRKRDPTKHVHREYAADHYLVRYEVREHDVRLDLFLKERYKQRSREVLKRAIDSGAITVTRNQGPHLQIGKLKPSTILLMGDEVFVMSERQEEPPVNFNYKVIYEDEVLFVIDKPPNLPVHPSGRFFFHTLLIHLKTKGGTHNTLDADEMYFLAHRIDKETSGILVLTKDSESCANVVAQFAERKTKKKYLAIVKGICPPEFEVNDPIARARNSRVALKMECMPESEGGLPASTRFVRLDVAGDFSLVEAHPKTGRQHQIRVHAAQAGFPLLGDKLYGVDEDFALLFYERERLTPEAEARLLHPRHALHSAGLVFTHPKTGKTMEFESPLPEDLRNFFEAQRMKQKR